MKKILNLLLIAGLCAGLSSCWKEDIPEAGIPRPQVSELKAVPGDMEVQLSWAASEKHVATDYIIIYNDADSKSVTLHTEGATEYLVTNLQNEFEYTFSVQAVYGEAISQVITAKAKPTTSRFPVKNLQAIAMSTQVTLKWEKPATTVLKYTLTYNMVDTPEAVTTKEIDKDATSYEITGLTDNKNYEFTIVAHYAKGEADPVKIKAMPSMMVIDTDPYFVDNTYVSIGQPVNFRFDREKYSSVVDVAWKFADDDIKTGDAVSHTFTAVGKYTVTFSGVFSGVKREWDIEINVRQYALEFTGWEQDGSAYNGFKGSCPVFSPDGKTIYNITFNKKTSLYAFDVLTGVEKWHFTPAKAPSYNPLTVNPVTGDIYFGTTAGSQFYAVTPEGTQKWLFEGVGSMQSCAPAVSADGSTVFAVDATGKVSAIDAATGTQKWTVTLDAAKGGGLLVNGSELIVGLNATNLYFLNVADGKEIAKVTLASKMTDIAGFAVAQDRKTVYVPHADGKISSIDIEAHKVIVNGLAVAGNAVYEPVVAPNGTVFVGSKDGSVYNVAGDLSKVNWTQTCPNGGNAFNYSHPCVDTNNQFYITAGQKLNITYIFSPAGEIISQWSYGTSNNQKQMGGNNYLNGVLYMAFIGASNDNGAFVGKYVGGERAETWSTHGGDICGSCCIK